MGNLFAKRINGKNNDYNFKKYSLSIFQETSLMAIRKFCESEDRRLMIKHVPYARELKREDAVWVKSSKLFLKREQLRTEYLLPYGNCTERKKKSNLPWDIISKNYPERLCS